MSHILINNQKTKAMTAKRQLLFSIAARIDAVVICYDQSLRMEQFHFSSDHTVPAAYQRTRFSAHTGI